jgi:Uncharacterized protein conserved in bacteria (DUF2330)
MRPSHTLAGALGALMAAGSVLAPFAARPAHAACCYFSALGSDVNQPSQKAFLTWDPNEQLESFTVQPRFEGNAADFGMVIPTPTRPRLAEMPRDFFKELAVFTILKPMPLDKYKPILPPFAVGAGGAVTDAAPEKSSVTVIEAGIVGSLDYKIISAERADDLFTWLKENQYQYGGDQQTLDFYIQKRWLFTVMKIDPKQMKRGTDGSYTGDVTPTRFTFSTDRLIYPLRITQISVPTETEALFYIQAPTKPDLPGPFSYQYAWVPMWRQALSFAVPEKVTPAERHWEKIADAEMPELALFEQSQRQKNPGWQPARLEWAKQITTTDIGMIDGTVKFDREADPEAIKQLNLLRGHIREGQWITKIRRIFRRGEMAQDLEFVRARLGGAPDDMEYVYILPTSPP